MPSSKDAKTPTNHRSELAELIHLICTQPDPRLDGGHPVILSHRDPLTEAINNPRSIALEHVIDFGYWIRRQAPSDNIPEVGRILSARLSIVESLPLTLPEYAMFGQQFANIIALDEKWAITHRKILFPQENVDAWAVAFSTYVRFTNPYRRPFEVLREDYLNALSQLDTTSTDEEAPRAFSEQLGHHLFMFYLWGMYSLTGPDSLLRMYYDKTASQPKHWAALFDHAGRLLRNTTGDIEPPVMKRVIEFADWRIEQGNKVELSQFTFWLSAKSLDARWRLETFSKILDTVASRDTRSTINLDDLNDLLPTNEDLVVECFSKLVQGLAKDDQLYIFPEKAKPILRIGLSSPKESVRAYAEAARESLLKASRFEFLDE